MAALMETDRKAQEKITVATVKMSKGITAQDLSDMLTTAFEGGSNYWIRAIRATKKDATKPEQRFLADDIATGHVTEIAVYDSEENDENGKPKKYLVTRGRMIEAFQIMADKYPRHFKDLAEENSDATTGDVWFQCAVFGETIYG